MCADISINLIKSDVRNQLQATKKNSNDVTLWSDEKLNFQINTYTKKVNQRGISAKVSRKKNQNTLNVLLQEQKRRQSLESQAAFTTSQKELTEQQVKNLNTFNSENTVGYNLETSEDTEKSINEDEKILTQLEDIYKSLADVQSNLEGAAEGFALPDIYSITSSHSLNVTVDKMTQQMDRISALVSATDNILVVLNKEKEVAQTQLAQRQDEVQTLMAQIQAKQEEAQKATDEYVKQLQEEYVNGNYANEGVAIQEYTDSKKADIEAFVAKYTEEIEQMCDQVEMKNAQYDLITQAIENLNKNIEIFDERISQQEQCQTEYKNYLDSLNEIGTDLLDEDLIKNNNMTKTMKARIEKNHKPKLLGGGKIAKNPYSNAVKSYSDKKLEEQIKLYTKKSKLKGIFSRHIANEAKSKLKTLLAEQKRRQTVAENDQETVDYNTLVTEKFQNLDNIDTTNSFGYNLDSSEDTAKSIDADKGILTKYNDICKELADVEQELSQKADEYTAPNYNKINYSGQCITAIKSANQQIDRLNVLYSIANNMKSVLNKEKETAQKQLEQRQEEAQKLQEEIQQLNEQSQSDQNTEQIFSQMEQKNAQLALINDAITALNNNIQELDEQITEQDKKLTNYDKQIDKLERQNEILSEVSNYAYVKENTRSKRHGLGGFVSSIAKAAVGIVKGVVKAAGKVIQSATNVASKAVSGVFKAVGHVIDKAGLDTLGHTIESVGEFAGGAVKLAGGVATLDKKEIKQGMHKMAENAQAAVSVGISVITGMATSGTLTSAVANVLGSSVAAETSVTSAVANVLGTSAATETVGRVTDNEAIINIAGSLSGSFIGDFTGYVQGGTGVVTSLEAAAENTLNRINLES